MQVEPTIVLGDADPIVRRGSVCATIADGRIQPARVDVDAPREPSRRDAVTARLAAAGNRVPIGETHLADGDVDEDVDEIIALLQAV